MLRLLAFSVGFCALLAMSIPAWAQAAQSSAIPFANDDRLQKSITIERRFVVLDEALRQIGEATGVSLRATGRVASENVVVLAANRPAVEVLEVLMDTLAYRWKKIRSANGTLRYEMYQDEKSGREEDRLRLERRKEGLRRLLENARLRAEPEGRQRAARLEALKRRQERSGDLAPAEQRALATERDTLRPLGSDEIALMDLVRELLPRIEERLLRGSTIRFSSTGAPGMDRLPGNMVRRVLTEVGKDARWKPRLAAAPRPIEVRLKVSVMWLEAMATLKASWDLGILPAPELGDAAKDYQRGATIWAALRPIEEKTERVVSDDPRLQQTVKARLVEKYPPHLIANDPTTYVPQTCLMDQLALLHEACPEISFIGDAYLTPLISMKGSGKVLDLLNEKVLGNGSGWRWDPRGYVMVRSCNVPDDRVASVPATFFLALYQRAVLHRGLTLDDFTWLATTLSDEQLMRLRFQQRPPLMTYVPGAMFDWWEPYEGCYDLRFYASLTPPQREMLTQRGLPANELSREQLELMLAVLDSNERNWGTPAPRSAEELAAFTVRLTETPLSTPEKRFQFEWRLPGQSEPFRKATITLRGWPDFTTVDQ